MPAARKPLILLGLIVLISTAVLVAGDKKSKSHPDSTLHPRRAAHGRR